MFAFRVIPIKTVVASSSLTQISAIIFPIALLSGLGKDYIIIITIM